MTAVTFKDVLRYGLGEIYDAQRQVLPILDRMETETQQESVRQRLRWHREETLQQIENLHRCFELLGTDAPRITCDLVRGITADYGRFHDQCPAPWAVEVYNLTAADRLEHFESASYDGLAQLAAALGHDDVRRLLEQNAAQAHAMTDWIRTTRASLLDQFVAKVSARPA